MLSLKNLLMAALLIFAVSIVGKAEAGIVTDKMPLQCYVDHKVTSYDLNSGQAVGWIDAEVDLIQIREIGGNGVARGTHPGRNGTVERLFWARDVFADTNYANRNVYVNGSHQVYRTQNSGSTIGSIANEEVTVVADNGNRAQIVYRLNNGTGYKMGWVPSSIVPPTPTPPNNNYAQPEDGDYYIVPINSTCAIDVPNNWHDEGTVLHIYNKNDSPAQTFRLERVGNGWYKIIHKDSGNVMNVQYGNNGNGTRLWLYHYDGSASSHWRFRDLGGGFYNIESQLPSNPFLEVQNGNPFNGAVLQLWQQHNGDAAKWTLKKASPQPGNKLQELINRWNGKRWVDHTYSSSSKQCKEFAQYIFNELYRVPGVGSGSTSSNPTNWRLNDIPSTIYKVAEVPENRNAAQAKEQFRNLFAQAQPGDFIQIKRGHGGAHSAIFVSRTSNGIQWFDANADGNNGIKLQTYSYDDLVRTTSKGYQWNVAMSLYRAR